MKQSALLEFESSAFPVTPGEDEGTNPGIYGKALAQWIAGQLCARGLPAGEVIAEDFGWCVPVASKPHRLYVACASTEDEQNQWRVFAFVEGAFMARLFGKDESAKSLSSLFSTVKNILGANPAIHGLREEAA
jgi:hypothetical protein